MVDTRPGTQLPPALIEYWVHGPGAAKIGWGSGGPDFEACKIEINKAIVKGGKPPLSDRVISGLCSDLHVIATGHRPGHAPGESAGHG